MANTFHQNLKQSFANFKAKYIGNLPNGVTVAQINNDLTANSQKFEASYQNGKYGFTIDGTFYEIGGGGMLLDTSNVVSLMGISSYTTTKDGELKIAVTNGTTGDIQINRKSIFATSTPDSSSVGILNFSFAIPAGTVITNTIETTASKARVIKFYPYL